jgi:hypothetical protein
MRGVDPRILEALEVMRQTDPRQYKELMANPKALRRLVREMEDLIDEAAIVDGWAEAPRPKKTRRGVKNARPH